MKKRYLLVLLPGLVLLMGFVGVLHGQNNPLDFCLFAMYTYEGEDYYVDLWVPDALWLNDSDEAPDPNWDGCFTSKGHRFRHGHPGNQFPIYDPNTSVYVTAAMNDAYWDAFWGEDWTRITTASTAYGTYDYAFQRDLNTFTVMLDKVHDDDYWKHPTITEVMPGDTHYGTALGEPNDYYWPNHCMLIVDLYTISGQCGSHYHTVKTARSKADDIDGGVYERTYDYPGYLGDYHRYGDW
jgi:hypothetical protein